MAALDCIMWVDAWASVGGYTVHGVWEGESAWECMCRWVWVNIWMQVWVCVCEGVCVQVWVRVRLSSGNHLKHLGMHYVCRHTFYIVSACIKPLVAVCMCSHSTHRHTPLSALKRVPTKFTTAADHTMLLGNNSMHHFTSLVPSSCTYVPWG